MTGAPMHKRVWHAPGDILLIGQGVSVGNRRDLRTSSGRCRPSRTRSVWRLVQWLLMIVGGVSIGWCGGVLADAYSVQTRAREALQHVPVKQVRVSTPRPVRRTITLQNGAPLAALSVPRLGLSGVVLEGSDDHTLRVGIGHIRNTSLPGETGNVAVAGHRDSFFRPLRNIQVGDDVMLDTPEQHLHYRVTSFHVVDAFDVRLIQPTRNAVLTLVTCYPFWFVGAAPDRFVVRASLVE